MTTLFHFPHMGFSGQDRRFGVLFLLIPVLLAAGLKPHPATDSALPEADSYRTPLPDTIFESNRWRIPPQEERDWRSPPPPPADWRTPRSSQSRSSSSTRTFELFPRYQPGTSSDYDMIEREDKPLIKMFEFGSR